LGVVCVTAKKAQAEEYAREMEERADRIAKGFEMEPGRVEFGAIWDRWWSREGRRRRGASTDDYKQFLEKHREKLRPFVLTPATAGAFAEQLDVLLDEKEDRGELWPQSLNRLRAGVFSMFECARDPKHRLWTAENPVQWVKRRKVPKRRYETVRHEQVQPLLAALPSPSLAAPWRWAAATMLYAGPVPGEVFGLWDAGTYDHSELEDERETLERVLSFRPAGSGAHGAHMGRGLEAETTKPAASPVSRAILRASDVGATGFEPATTCTPRTCRLMPLSATGCHESMNQWVTLRCRPSCHPLTSADAA
jgi:hypothetical protein